MCKCGCHLSFRSQTAPAYPNMKAPYESGLRYFAEIRKRPANARRFPTPVLMASFHCDYAGVGVRIWNVSHAKHTRHLSSPIAISEIEIIQNLKGHKLESRVTFSSARVVTVSPPTSLYHWKYQQVNIFRKTSADYTVQHKKKLQKN